MSFPSIQGNNKSWHQHEEIKDEANVFKAFKKIDEINAIINEIKNSIALEYIAKELSKIEAFKNKKIGRGGSLTRSLVNRHLDSILLKTVKRMLKIGYVYKAEKIAYLISRKCERIWAFLFVSKRLIEIKEMGKGIDMINELINLTVDFPVNDPIQSVFSNKISKRLSENSTYYLMML